MIKHNRLEPVTFKKKYLKNPCFRDGVSGRSFSGTSKNAVIRPAVFCCFMILALSAGLVFRTAAAAPPDPDPGLSVISALDRAALTRVAANPKTGILVTDDQGRVLMSQNPDTLRVPASILKILTSLAALEQWGPEYRFVTRAAWDPDLLILYLQGMGDPLFVSEAILDFCRQIIEKTGMKKVHKIIVDQGYFAPDITIPGTGRSLNPYDATTGALCANFNTLNFAWDAASGTFVSAEPQTPLLERFKKIIRQTGLRQGRILLEKEVRPLYPGLLMARFLKDLGVDVTGPVETGHMPAMAEEAVLTLNSPWTLEEVLEKLLRYSNNFIANQVMLALGAHRYGPPATLEKGVRALTDFAAGLPGWETAQIAEGSGISRQNRITPAQMGQLLLAFMPHHELLRRTGTQFYKTGTLTGIRTRAGYFIGTDHRLYPFTCWGQALPF
jgi:serine-type D-Ala-D-Ala carboxypeptidase/endopeptidase (penicillin-binding protein 4)